MSWLFRKKDVPKVPPESRLDEKALKFTFSPPPERIIEPEKAREMVGFEKPVAFPEEIRAAKKNKAKTEEDFSENFLEEPAFEAEPAIRAPGEELFIKVDVYQRILGELDFTKKNLSHLGESCKKVESSEFNEEKHFSRLRKSMKSLHDNLLHIDKTIFKS